MTSIWHIQDDYPERLIGSYDREAGPDRFLLRQGSPLAPELRPWRFRFGAAMKQLRKMDDLANSAMVPLVSPRLSALLRKFAPDDVQLIPAEVNGTDGSIHDYTLVNATFSVPAIDLTSSVFTRIQGTDAIMSFKRLVLQAGCLGPHMVARCAEYRSYLLVGSSLVDAIEAAGMTGMQFSHPEEA